MNAHTHIHKNILSLSSLMHSTLFKTMFQKQINSHSISFPYRKLAPRPKKKSISKAQKNLSVNQHPFPFFLLSIRWDWCVCHHYYYYYFSLLRFLLLFHINATSYHIASCFFFLTGVNWFLFAFIAYCGLLPLHISIRYFVFLSCSALRHRYHCHWQKSLWKKINSVGRERIQFHEDWNDRIKQQHGKT